MAVALTILRWLWLGWLVAMPLTFGFGVLFWTMLGVVLGACIAAMLAIIRCGTVRWLEGGGMVVKPSSEPELMRLSTAAAESVGVTPASTLSFMVGPATS